MIHEETTSLIVEAVVVPRMCELVDESDPHLCADCHHGWAPIGLRAVGAQVSLTVRRVLRESDDQGRELEAGSFEHVNRSKDLIMLSRCGVANLETWRWCLVSSVVRLEDHPRSWDVVICSRRSRAADECDGDEADKGCPGGISHATNVRHGGIRPAVARSRPG